MRALTLTQPWAGLVATGVKLVENRPWKLPPSMLGQRFAIHAGKTLDIETVDDVLAEGELEHAAWYQRGAVLATARLVKCVTNSQQIALVEQRRWFFGPFGFVLDDVWMLPAPVPCKGMLGFWTLPTEVERAVLGVAP